MKRIFEPKKLTITCAECGAVSRYSMSHMHAHAEVGLDNGAGTYRVRCSGCRKPLRFSETDVVLAVTASPVEK